MRVSFLKENFDNNCARFIFSFVLDSDDKRKANSFNAGNGEIILGADTCSFDFPFDVAIPHPDLVCMAALKIVSPYIGSTLIMDRPISRYFAEMAKTIYPNIKYINTCNISPRQVSGERYSISFSGGADSLAAANLSPDGTILILSARKQHPLIGKFESWYSTEANQATLANMPQKFVKICVKSDFEYLSTNGKWCIYPDRYAFTIPSILLADHFNLTGILVGDVYAAFSADETKEYSLRNFEKMRDYYKSVNLDLDSPVKGVTEIGSEIINRAFNNGDIATTCQYGSFKKPCMRCIKCFRKSLIKAYLDGKNLSDSVLDNFEKSRAVQNFADKISDAPMKFQYTFHEVLKSYNLSKFSHIQKIKNKADAIDKDSSFITNIYLPGYQESYLPKTKQYSLQKLLKLFNHH